MNRGEMRTEVRDIIGEDAADFWKDAELNRYLGEAQHRFLAEERWPWLVTEFTSQLLAGDPELLLTAGVAHSRHINFTLNLTTDDRPYPVTRVDANKGFELQTMWTASATYPAYFYIVSIEDEVGDGTYQYVAKFVPTPTADMDVAGQYTRAGVTMDADADLPDCPPEYHKALVHFAAGTAWLKELNGGAKAREQFQLYQGVVDQARAEMFTQPEDDPIVMGKDEPQYMEYPGREPTDPWMLRIPDTLGP